MKKIIIVLALICATAFLAGCPSAVDDSTGPVDYYCVDGSCNTTIINPPPEEPPIGCLEGDTVYLVYMSRDGDTVPEAYLDSNHDGVADTGITDRLCLASEAEVPFGWTIKPGPPWDICPDDPTNQCGTAIPTITIFAGDTNGNIMITANPIYSAGTFTKVEYLAGSVQIGTVTNSTDNWRLIWYNPNPGTYDIYGVGYTSDGKTAVSNHITVTIEAPIPQCKPLLDIQWSLKTTAYYYQGLYAGMCFISMNGQNPEWQVTDYRTCHDSANGCRVIEEAYAPGLNQGFCEFNITAPRGANGNPMVPWTTVYGDVVDYALVGYAGPPVVFSDHIVTPTVFLNYDCQHTVQVPVIYIWNPWGSNYRIDYTGAVDVVTKNTINVFISSQTDMDGDGLFDYCPPGATGCVADKCIRYADTTNADSNNDGIGDACVGRPNPSENDSDNDWYLDGDDLYPLDRTRF